MLKYAKNGRSDFKNAKKWAKDDVTFLQMNVIKKFKVFIIKMHRYSRLEKLTLTEKIFILLNEKTSTKL
jgi:hypothetical protein